MAFDWRKSRLGGFKLFLPLNSSSKLAAEPDAPLLTLDINSVSALILTVELRAETLFLPLEVVGGASSYPSLRVRLDFLADLGELPN